MTAIADTAAARTELPRAQAERVADRVESAAARLQRQVGAELDRLGARAETELEQGARTAAD